MLRREAARGLVPGAREQPPVELAQQVREGRRGVPIEVARPAARGEAQVARRGDTGAESAHEFARQRWKLAERRHQLACNLGNNCEMCARACIAYASVARGSAQRASERCMHAFLLLTGCKRRTRMQASQVGMCDCTGTGTGTGHCLRDACAAWGP